MHDRDKQQEPDSGGGKWKWIVLALSIYFVVDKALQMTGSDDTVVRCDDYRNVASGPLLSVAKSRRTTDEFDPFRQDRSSSLSRDMFLPRRLASSGSSLSGSSSSSPTSSVSSNGSSGSSGASHDHTYEALYYLIFEMFVGSMVIFVSMFPAFHSLQHTVALFLLGLAFSVLNKIDGFTWFIGPLGRSYDMWMDIDPHLLLFTLLPPLLAGDAMTIDTHVVRSVGYQCLFLAGPGVGLNATIAAGFLRLYLGTVCGYPWNFTLCMVTGAILCATDPVAVVALLKELGAPPRLTVQIQGESLLNDGTAIVLFLVFYRSLEGYAWDFGEVVVFLVKTALYAFLLGMVVGSLFYAWIKAANNKFDHSSTIIQVSLTLAAAYGAFLISEGCFHISGVLATVASSLILAHKMWPDVVDHEAMHIIWHMFENLGNIIIFFLAGCLVGEALDGIPLVDYLHLIVIYLVLLVIRGGLIFGCRPLLTRLGGKTGKQRLPVTLADAAVMTWGGLRGAVGLALAIQVAMERADEQIPELEAKRVLFYVGGVALLTLVVNATTCPWLVKALGITQLPESKRKMLRQIKGKLKDIVLEKAKTPDGGYRDNLPVHSDSAQLKHSNHDHIESAASFFCQNGRNAVIFEKTLDAVTNDLMLLLQIMGEHLDHSHQRERETETRGKSMIFDFSAVAYNRTRIKHHEDDVETIANFTKSCRLLGEMKIPIEFVKAHMNPHGHSHAGHDGPDHHRPCDEDPYPEKEMDELIYIFKSASIDFDWQRTINECFLCLLKAEYWHMLHTGLLASGEAETMIGSVLKALSTPLDLNDFSYFCQDLEMDTMPGDAGISEKRGLQPKYSSLVEKIEPNNNMPKHLMNQSPLEKFVEGSVFGVVIMSCIIANSILVMIDGELNTESSSRDQILFALEASFNIVFTVEFVLKFMIEGGAYFKETWNVFDFVLVILGWVGIVLMLIEMVTGAQSDVSANSGLARVVKLLKVLRAVRMVRLMRMISSVGAKLRSKTFSFGVGDSLTKLALLEAFIKAHKHAQAEMLTFFGSDGMPECPEVARCIMQSQVGVLSSIALCWSEEQSGAAKSSHLQTIKDMLATIHIVEELEHFVTSAMESGIIDLGEAEGITHVMHDTEAAAFAKIRELRAGWLDSEDLQETDMKSLSSECDNRLDQVKKDSLSSMDWEEALPVGDPPDPEYGVEVSRFTEVTQEYVASDISIAPSLQSEPAPEPYQTVEVGIKKKREKKQKKNEAMSSNGSLASTTQKKTKSKGKPPGSTSKAPKMKAQDPNPETVGARK